jgi:predicted P-loop ATPase
LNSTGNSTGGERLIELTFFKPLGGISHSDRLKAFYIHKTMSTIKHESDRLKYPVSIVQGNQPEIVRVGTIRDILNLMVSDKQIKQHTFKIRNTTGKVQKALKEKTTAFILGEFDSKRNDKNVKKYIQVMGFDIDKIPHQSEFQSIFEALQECEFTFAAFPSVRGKGIRFLVCHDGSQKDHKHCYNQIAAYYADFLGIQLSSESTKHCHIDLQCSNISRHWFLGHADIEEVHHNDDSKLFHFIKEEQTNAPTGESGSTPDKLKLEDKIKLLKIIANEKKPFQSGSRNSHVFYLSSMMAENGITCHDALQSMSDYVQQDFDLKEIRGTVVNTYKRYKENKSNKKYSDSQLIALCKKIHFEDADNLKQVESIVRVYPEIEQEAENKKPTKYELALDFINANYRLERNQITRFVEDSGVSLTDNEYNSIYIDLKYNRYSINKNDTLSLINSNRIPSYNPFVRFVENNSHYSSNGHILKLCETIQTPTGINIKPEFVQIFVSKWLVGMVASAFGRYVNPLLLVLCGGQNNGKTEWFRRLLPDELKPYLAESKLDDGKDSEILMTDKLLILDDEYGGKSKRDSKKLKELISKDYVTVRPAYARTAERLPRIATLGGTSNEFDVLSDITGNRRVIPIKVIDIDKPAYNKIDKVALFMEIYRTFRDWESGRSWELTKDEILLLNMATTEFEEVSVEREMILKYFRIPKVGESGISEFFQTSEVAEHIQGCNNMRLNVRRIGAELRALGLERVNGKGENRKMKGYFLVQKAQMPTLKAKF